MILRNLSKNIKAQNWSTVIVELVIVIVGVYVGIQAANWNEARADRAREAVYLERLDADFDVITERLEGGKAVFSRNVENLQLLIRAHRIYNGEQSGDMPDDEALLAAFGTLGEGRVPAGSAATFEEMVSSGDLRILSNDTLRNTLFEYDQFASVSRDGWRTLRDHYLQVRPNLVGLATLVVDPDEEQLSATRVDSFDKQRFLNQIDLDHHLSELMAIDQNQYGLAATQLELAEQIEALIEQERDVGR